MFPRFTGNRPAASHFELRSMRGAIDIYYQGRIKSNFGTYPVSRLGGGPCYRPMGFALQTLIADNGVTIQQNHFAPFFVGNLQFCEIAVNESAAA